MNRPKATNRPEQPRRRPTDKQPAANSPKQQSHPPSHADVEPKMTPKEPGLAADPKHRTHSPQNLQKKDARITTRTEQHTKRTPGRNNIYYTKINQREEIKT
jgi:hypothetical protein